MSNIKVGTIEGTGAAINVEIGFIPSSVRLTNVDGDCRALWTKDMDDDSMYKINGASSMTADLVASNGITPSEIDDSFLGFTIGADSDLNASAETIVYEAIEE